MKMQLDLLDKGVEIELPNSDGSPGTTRWCLKGWAINFAADYEARMQCLPFGDGINSNRECPDCDRYQRDKVAYEPMAFVRAAACVHSSGKRKQQAPKRARTNTAAAAAPAPPARRDWVDDKPGAPFSMRCEDAVLAQVQSFAAAKTGNQRDEITRKTGVAKPGFPLMHLPHFAFLSMSGQDLMHVEFSSGNLSHEAAQLFYVHTRIHKYYTFEELCDAINNYDYPRGHLVRASNPSPYA